MQITKWSLASINVFVIIGLIFSFMGCCKKPVQTVSMGTEQATGQEMAAQKQSAAETADVKTAGAAPAPVVQATSGQSPAAKKVTAAKYVEKNRQLRSSYVVKKGDSLWWIAKYSDIYNDPFLWPVLYDANKKEIKNPNKIRPGLNLQVPRAGYKPDAVRAARQKAGAGKPYNPPARAVPPMD